MIQYLLLRVGTTFLVKKTSNGKGHTAASLTTAQETLTILPMTLTTVQETLIIAQEIPTTAPDTDVLVVDGILLPF